MVPTEFVRALDGFEAVLAGVAPGRWSAPSPCAGWSAADVAGHVIGDLRATEALAGGRARRRARLQDPGSAAGDDPLAAWRVARADMMAALKARGPGPARARAGGADAAGRGPGPVGDGVPRAQLGSGAGHWPNCRARSGPGAQRSRPGTAVCPAGPVRLGWLARNALCRTTPMISPGCWRFSAAVTPASES